MASNPPVENTPKKIIRKGANGVLLKNFETVLHDVFSSSSSSVEICQQALQALSPQYSKLPPFLDDTEENEIVENARKGWDAASTALENDQCNLDDKHGSSSTSSQQSPPPWPFDKRTNLPSCGCVRGGDEVSGNRKPKKTKTGKDIGGVGDVYNHQRAWRKEMQLANMIQCVFALLPDHVRNHSTCSSSSGDDLKSKRKFRIVDFAGGTGHLAVPLALLLPHCEVVCVDLKKWSLDLLHRRVDGVAADGDGNEDVAVLDKNTQNGQHKQPCNSNIVQVSQKVPNLSSYLGSIQSYTDDFDIGISLHACGEASDCVLRKCLEKKASFVVCSCCCGKLRRDALNPYTFQSTGGNEKEVLYPQSKILSSFMNATVDDNSHDEDGNTRRLETAKRFDEIAKAADYSELGDVRKPRNACRRAAKSLVEWDRLLYCKEYDATDTNVHVVLTRMVPWESSTKNDILIGWYDPSCNPYRQNCGAFGDDNPSSEESVSDMPPDDPSSQVDFQITLQHLFGESTTVKGNGKDTVPVVTCGQNDWSAEEVEEIQTQLETFVKNVADDSLRFHRGMGSRKRKLIHFVAEKMGLRHWGEGKKDAEKIVVVARRRSEHKD